MSLSLETLRQANLARLPIFKNAKGEFSHPEGVHSWTSEKWLRAVVGEIGEYADECKKVDRGDFTEEEAKLNLGKELADVLIYLDILALSHDINLSEAVREKWNEVSRRINAPIRINSTDYFHHLEGEVEIMRYTYSDVGLAALYVFGHTNIPRFADCLKSDESAWEVVSEEAERRQTLASRGFAIDNIAHGYIRQLTNDEKERYDIENEAIIWEFCKPTAPRSIPVTAFHLEIQG